MIQLLTSLHDHEKAMFCIFLLCTLTGISSTDAFGSGSGSGEMMSPCPSSTAVFEPASSIPTVRESELGSSLAPTTSIMVSTTDSTTDSNSVLMSSITIEAVSSTTPVTSVSISTSSTTPLPGTTSATAGPTTTPFGPILIPTGGTATPTGTTDAPITTPPRTAGAPTVPTTTPAGAPTSGTTTPALPPGSTTQSSGTTDGSISPTNPFTPATPAESGNTLSEKLIAVIIGVGCGIVCLLIIIVCCSVIIVHTRRNTQANSKSRGLMQHVKVTVLGDAELQPLNDSSDPDISHGKKNIAASCDNFVAHLAAAEAEARDDPESAPDRTEQGGDNAKEGQGALTLGTFGFPMVVIESSKDSGQESSENKDADNKSQSKSKTDTSSSHQDKSTTDGSSESSGEKPKPNTDEQKLLETNTGAQQAQKVADTSSHKEEPKNQTSSAQAAKLQDSKASVVGSPFEYTKLLEPKADDALTLAIKELQDGKIDAKQETADIQEASKPKSDAPASKTTGEKQVVNEGASSSAQGAERMSLTDAEKALAQMLKDLEITRL